MKKYPKMTFAALSTIALNFSCLAMDPQRNNAPEQNPNEVIRIHDNFQNRKLTPLSTEEQILLLKSAITASNVHLAEIILEEYIGKAGRKYYYMQIEGRFFDTISDEQFKDLQLFSLNDLAKSNDRDDSFDNKHQIFQFITSKFFEVTKNKEYAYQTTANEIYHNLDSFCIDNLGALIDLPLSPEGKMEITKQLLNYAKQDNNIINAYSFIFFSLAILPFISYTSTSFSSFLSIFKNQSWLLQFISEYLDQALNDTTKINLNKMPIDFIKDIAPDLYYEKFFIFLKKCITEDATEVIDTLLPIDEKPLHYLKVPRLSPEYLNLALEEGHDGDIISSHIALYTKTSSSLTEVALTLTRLTQETRLKTLECIKDVNSVLHDLLLKELQRLNAMNFQQNGATGQNLNEVIPSHLSAEEQISLLKSAISASNKLLAEKILKGYIGKIDSKYYYISTAEKFFETMSDQQFEELQLFSLDDLKDSAPSGQPFYDKRKIFELITAKFFEVTNNKEYAYQTTANKMHSNRDSFGADELGELVDLIPSPDSKMAFARQLLNEAKQYNDIDAYQNIFSTLEIHSEINMFKNQAWLQPFIREYLEQTLSGTTDINLKDMPIYFIKEAAPDLYNEKFPLFLKKCIIDDAYTIIKILLPLDEIPSLLPLEDRRLSSEYLNLALLEGYRSIDMVLFYIVSYTDTSSDLTDVALTLTSFTQEKRQDILEDINDTNSVLYHSLLEALQSLEH